MNADTQFVQVSITKPSDKQFFTHHLPYEYQDGIKLKVRMGTWDFELNLPKKGEDGTWRIEHCNEIVASSIQKRDVLTTAEYMAELKIDADQPLEKQAIHATSKPKGHKTK